MLGTIYQYYLERQFSNKKANIITYPGEAEAFSSLLSKSAKVDAWATERVIADYALSSTKEKNKEALRFQVQGVLFVSQASMIVSKSNMDLKKMFDSKLHELIQKKVLTQLSLQQFNSDILCKSK